MHILLETGGPPGRVGEKSGVAIPYLHVEHCDEPPSLLAGTSTTGTLNLRPSAAILKRVFLTPLVN